MKRCVLPIAILLILALPLLAQTPGQKVDETTMDLQDWYSNHANQIVVNPSNGEVSLAYAWSDQPVVPLVYADPPPSFQMAYPRYRNVTTGAYGDALPVYGNPSLRLAPDGRYFIFANHGYVPWTTYGWWGKGAVLFEETGVESAEFDSLYWFDENPIAGPTAVLGCEMEIDEAGVIHLIQYDGWGLATLYKNSDDGGLTFSQVVVFGASSAGYVSVPTPKIGVTGDHYGCAIATGTDGKVGLLLTDQGGNVYLAESDDYGVSWDTTTAANGLPTCVTAVTDFAPIDTNMVGGDPDNIRTDRFGDLMYDAGNNAHAVFEAAYWLNEVSVYNDRNPWPGYGIDLPYPANYKGRIMHWSEATGLTTVAVSSAPNTDLDKAYVFLPGRNRGTLVTYPNFAYDADNDVLYVGYNQYSEMYTQMIDPASDPYAEGVGRYIGLGELYLVSSFDGGATWNTPYNVSNSPNFDERNFVLNDDVVDGKVHAMYIGDDHAGYESIEYFGAGSAVTSGVYHFSIPVGSVGVEDKDNVIPEQFEMAQNYPNPFNPSTTIEFSLPKAGQITLSVYNVLGQRVRTLVDEDMSAGKHKVIWDATNDLGVKVGTGLYIYRIDGDFGTMVRKMTLMK